MLATADPTTGPTGTTTDTPVLAILEHLEQAWNTADGTAFGEVFTEDADFTNILGEHIEGRAAIVQGHQGIFDTIYAGSVNRFQLDRVRPVAPGAAIAVVTSTLDAPIGPLQGVHQARFTMTLVEQGGRWAVAAFHNTLVAPPR